MPTSGWRRGRALITTAAEGYPNPLHQRFVELPGVLAAYINHLAESNSSQWPAEKLRAAVVWHYTKPKMLEGGHPHDR